MYLEQSAFEIPEASGDVFAAILTSVFTLGAASFVCEHCVSCS